jgi:transaldolase
VKPIGELGVKLFADGANLDDMVGLYRRPYIRGFTTNPTLMHKAGIRDYRRFAHDVLAAIPDRPISFEVFSDDFCEMERQAREISAWGAGVYVKIPVTDTQARPADDLIHRLSHSGVKVNVTAVLTLEQVGRAVNALDGGAPSNISLFAGRIADTGRDPVPMVSEALAIAGAGGSIELIWASPRELLNVFHADAIGCPIITLTTELVNKLDLIGKDLGEVSLDTVKMFRNDALKAGFTLSEETQVT